MSICIPEIAPHPKAAYEKIRRQLTSRQRLWALMPTPLPAEFLRQLGCFMTKDEACGRGRFRSQRKFLHDLMQHVTASIFAKALEKGIGWSHPLFGNRSLTTPS